MPTNIYVIKDEVIGAGPNPVWRVSLQKEEIWIRERPAQQEDNVKTHGEHYPPAKEHPRLPGDKGEAWIRCSLTALRSSQSCRQ